MVATSNKTRKLRVSSRRFQSMSLILGAFLLLIRLYDMLVISNVSAYPSGTWINQIYGLGYDVLLFFRILLIIIIPLIVIGIYSRLAQKIIFIILALVLILGDLALVQYFSVARVPLGADLFGYSQSEMMQTINASGQLSFLKLLPFIVLSLAIISAYIFIPTITISTGIRRTLTISTILSVFLGGFLNPFRSDYKNEFDLYVASNKISFFTNSVKTSFENEVDQEDNLNENVVALADAAVPEANEFKYISPDYPLLHKENTPDVLGQYFNKGVRPPSFVFILVESLGRSYSGENAILGSFTPFLDSLMQKSLYWENNLSTSGRTFEVLPSVLASLPFGENGFAELGNKMPDHLSMISLLKKNAGYQSSFYYGGEAPFDNMELFMKRQGISKVVDQKDFGSEYKRLPANSGGFSWGYGEKEIFRKYLNDYSSTNDAPRLDVMLTLAMHNPFLIQNQEQYNQRVLARLSKIGLTEDQISYNKSYIPQFASMLYFDDALRGFISNFSKRKEFENTIFIITGDHRMPEIPIATQLDRFHVPLVIYSPLLKRAEKFSSIVSHLDITPTLLSFLHHNYGIKQPSVSAWIGRGLDVETSFQNINSYPMMRNKSEFMDFIDGEYYIAGDDLYTVSRTLDIEPIENTEIKAKLKSKFNTFKKANLIATMNNKIIPDSIKIK